LVFQETAKKRQTPKPRSYDCLILHPEISPEALTVQPRNLMSTIPNPREPSIKRCFTFIRLVYQEQRKEIAREPIQETIRREREKWVPASLQFAASTSYFR
jgi:hypothetical protein